MRDLVEPDRIAVPVGDDDAARSAAAWSSWPLALTTKFCRRRTSCPVGRLTFAFVMAVATSSMPMPWVASLCGSTSMRTADFCEPMTLTCATPLTDRDALRDRRLRVFVDHRERQRRRLQHEKHHRLIGRVDLLYDGGAGICGGSARVVLAIIACTSCAAASMLRFKSNCSVMLVLPCELVELIDVRPAIAENCFSSGSATAVAIVSGLAPGSAGIDLNGRKVDGRQVADRQLPVGHHAEHQDAQHDERRRDRPLDEERRQVHGCTFEPSAAGPVLILTRVPGNQPQLAVGHDDLVRLQAALDDRRLGHLCARPRRSADRRSVRLDDEDVAAPAGRSERRPWGRRSRWARCSA